jgi:hypothetical protein
MTLPSARRHGVDTDGCLPPRSQRQAPASRAGCLCLLLAVAASARAASPLADVHAADTPADALAQAERLAAQPGMAELGVDYLRGDLLESLGRPQQAARAFATAMRSSPALAAYARYRLARLELAQGHPEIAAGLVAPLLAASSPEELRHQAAVVLRRALAAGGDCRLLASVHWATLSAGDRRALAVQRADCARAQAPERAGAELAALLAAEPGDEAAREAAVRLLALHPSAPPAEVALVLGRAFQRHRRPDLAFSFLAPLVERSSARLQEEAEVEAWELIAEAQIQRGDLLAAAGTFAALAARVRTADLRARAQYHEGWTHDLLGNPMAALPRYVRAANFTPVNATTPVALLAVSRTQWRLHRERDALRTHELLRLRREWGPHALRGALFLASSTLARGEVGNAPALLQQAAQLSGSPTPEIRYWSGRLAELQGRRATALDHYLHLLRGAPYHPLTAQARHRLASGPMAGTAEQAAERWRHSPRAEERLHAWLLLPPGDPRREPLRIYLYQRFARDPAVAPYLRLAAVPAREWPLWRDALPSSEERVLALGGWQEVGLDVIDRHFPLRSPHLAFTAAQRLAEEGDLQRSLQLADELHRSGAVVVPPQLLPLPLRQLLLPRPWPERVTTAAGRHGLPPSLFYGLMRAASGFDPRALAPWGGRGLLLVDARDGDRLAAAAGLPGVRAEDLFDPRVAIPVGAARLAELDAAFPDRPELALAAHLSGIPQARLWASWCGGEDPAELLTKIGAEDLRAVLVQVLTARAAYAELYGS